MAVQRMSVRLLALGWETELHLLVLQQVKQLWGPVGLQLVGCETGCHQQLLSRQLALPFQQVIDQQMLLLLLHHQCGLLWLGARYHLMQQL